MGNLINSKNKLLIAILALSLAVFSLGYTSSTADAAKKGKNQSSKKKKKKKPKINPKTDAGKLQIAARWAAKVTKERKETPANPNIPGLSPGIGLEKRYIFTGEYTALFRYTKFLEKAKVVAIKEQSRKTRSAKVYSIYNKARAAAYNRATLRRSISKKEINETRKTKIAAANKSYQNAVKVSRERYQEERTAIANYRKKRAAQIIRWAKKRHRALNRKIRATSSSAVKARLRGQKKVIQGKRAAAHRKNALRYQIKMSAATEARNGKLSVASDNLVSRVQSIENTLAKQSDEDATYINARTGVEVSLATSWRTRALTALARTPGKR